MSLLQKLTSLSKRRGFIFPTSNIYGGLSGFWDYGPLGTELKRNIKEAWWEEMVHKNENIVGADGAIIMNPRVWEASGHLESFTDPMVECIKCKKRFREDHLDGESCPDCGGELGETKQFNLLVEASLGAVEGEKLTAFLRGEITQGAHVNFKNILNSTRQQVPFGIAQIGKAFRNEISPGQFTFRSREFEQMELQFYVEPDEADDWMKKWKERRMDWYKSLGLSDDNIRFREHGKDELAHYAREAWDIEYDLEGEWLEFEGVHNRGDWDLSRHQEYSGETMEYRDPHSGDKFTPFVVETSAGTDRTALFFLADAYTEDEENDRTVLQFHPKLAPYKAAIFPLLANKPDLVDMAREIYDDLKQEFSVAWDARGNIGKRYRYQDEVGTPFCVTVDFDSLEGEGVTVRDRDSMEQDRVKVDELSEYLEEKIEG